MHDFELVFILLLGFPMLLIGLFMLYGICDHQIARAARRLARRKKGPARPGGPDGRRQGARAGIGAGIRAVARRDDRRRRASDDSHDQSR